MRGSKQIKAESEIIQDKSMATIKLEVNEDGHRQITLMTDNLTLTGLIAQTITEIIEIRHWKNGVMFFSCNIGEEEIYDFNEVADELDKAIEYAPILRKIKKIRIENN